MPLWNCAVLLRRSKYGWGGQQYEPCLQTYKRHTDDSDMEYKPSDLVVGAVHE
jgi:hypothetical protein